jgi:hypothetical protein
LGILENYSGANNYILKLKYNKEHNKKFYPTRAQSEYITTFHETSPKVAKKWVDLDPYFAKKIADEKFEEKKEKVPIKKKSKEEIKKEAE